MTQERPDEFAKAAIAAFEEPEPPPLSRATEMLSKTFQYLFFFLCHPQDWPELTGTMAFHCFAGEAGASADSKDPPIQLLMGRRICDDGGNEHHLADSYIEQFYDILHEYIEPLGDIAIDDNNILHFENRQAFYDLIENIVKGEDLFILDDLDLRTPKGNVRSLRKMTSMYYHCVGHTEQMKEEQEYDLEQVLSTLPMRVYSRGDLDYIASAIRLQGVIPISLKELRAALYEESNCKAAFNGDPHVRLH